MGVPPKKVFLLTNLVDGFLIRDKAYRNIFNELSLIITMTTTYTFILANIGLFISSIILVTHYDPIKKLLALIALF
jgi:hypothetical protein